MNNDLGPNLKHATFAELLAEIGSRCRTLIACYCIKELKPPEDYELNWYKTGPIWECEPLLDYLSARVQDRFKEVMKPPPPEEETPPSTFG